MEHIKQDFSDALFGGYDPDCKSADGLASRMSRRSYECVFCKRGFTSAQALGGHMNIHRKGRAGATHMVPSLSNSIPNYSGVEPGKHHAPMESRRGCYSSCFTAPKQSYSGKNCEVSCGNLSLQIELSCVQNYEMRSTDKESDEIDLELRLGQYGR